VIQDAPQSGYPSSWQRPDLDVADIRGRPRQDFYVHSDAHSSGLEATVKHFDLVALARGNVLEGELSSLICSCLGDLTKKLASFPGLDHNIFRKQ